MTEKSECCTCIWENALNKVRVSLKILYFTPPPDHLFFILHTSQIHCPQEKIKANGEPNLVVANLIFKKKKKLPFHSHGIAFFTEVH